MSDIKICEVDFVPPFLVRSNKNVLGASLSAKKINEHRTHFTYAISWEEDANTRTYSGKEAVDSDYEPINHPINTPDMMTLSQQTDGRWAKPYSFEMVWTRALAFTKSSEGQLLKNEFWAEYPSTLSVGRMVQEMLDSIPYDRTKAKVYLCPVSKNTPLCQLIGQNLLEKTVDQLDLHNGKLFLVVDYVDSVAK